MLRKGTAQTRAFLHILTRGDILPIVRTDVPMTSALCEETILRLADTYPFLRTEVLTATAFGRPVRTLTIGEGDRKVIYSAAHHANEWITTPLLLTFLEEYCLSLLDGDTLYGYDAAELYRRTTLSIVPMVDPDGVDLVTGYLHDGPWYQRARQWAENYPSIPVPEGWKANLNGVDLNLQYPAGWEEAKKIKESMGFTGPAPRDYVGTAPLTQPEALAVYRHTLQNDFRLTLSYHTQGNIIYWRYLDYLPPRSREIADAMAKASGYSVEETPPVSGYAGYKDWFIQTYDRPGYTIEAGQGASPLPLTEFDALYADNLGILVLGLALAAQPQLPPAEEPSAL